MEKDVSSVYYVGRQAARDVLLRVLSTFGTYRSGTFYHVYVLRWGTFCSCISVLPKSKRRKNQCTNNPSDLPSNVRYTINRHTFPPPACKKSNNPLATVLIPTPPLCHLKKNSLCIRTTQISMGSPLPCLHSTTFIIRFGLMF
jgi:hypothetical protein